MEPGIENLPMKLGVEISYSHFLGNSNFYTGLGFNPGILVGSYSQMDEIRSDDYASRFALDGAFRIGNQLSSRVDTNLFVYFGLNDIISYSLDADSFSFKSRQLGITVNYLFLGKEDLEAP